MISKERKCNHKKIPLMLQKVQKCGKQIGTEKKGNQ